MDRKWKRSEKMRLSILAVNTRYQIVQRWKYLSGVFCFDCIIFPGRCLQTPNHQDWCQEDGQCWPQRGPQGSSRTSQRDSGGSIFQADSKEAKIELPKQYRSDNGTGAWH